MNFDLTYSPEIFNRYYILIKASINQIKLLRKLSHRKHREKEHLFIIEGERAVEQILEHKLIDVDSVFIDIDKGSSSLSFDKVYSLDSKTFIELSNTESPQGILALCKMPSQTSFTEIKKIDSGVIVATDAIQDPGNLGTIIRTSTWFGTKAIILGSGTVDLFNPKVVRSTMGATGTLPFINGKLSQILDQLEKNGWQVLLLDGNQGAVPISEIVKTSKIILVVGNEANGIDEHLINAKRKRVLIPSIAQNRSVESLNAAVALSIGLWNVNN